MLDQKFYSHAILNPLGGLACFALPIFTSSLIEPFSYYAQVVGWDEKIVEFELLESIPTGAVFVETVERCRGDKAFFCFYFSASSIVLGERRQVEKELQRVNVDVVGRPFLEIEIANFLNDTIAHRRAIWRAAEQLAQLNSIRAAEWRDGQLENMDRFWGDRQDRHSSLFERDQRIIIGNKEGRKLIELQHFNEAAAIHREVFECFENNHNSRRDAHDVIRAAGNSVFYWSFSLDRLGRWDQALKLWGRTIQFFESNRSHFDTYLIAGTMFLESWCLEELGRKADALMQYRQVMLRFGDDSEYRVAEWLAKAMVNCMVLLVESGDTGEAGEIVEALVSKFGTRTEWILRDQVARGLQTMYEYHWGEGEWQQALERSGELLEYSLEICDESHNSDFLDRVAWAYIIKGRSLWKLGRTKEAAELQSEAVKWCLDRIDREITLASLRVDTASVLYFLGKYKESEEAMGEIIRIHSKSADINVRKSVEDAIVNQIVNMGVGGDPDLAIVTADQALLRGGLGDDAMAHILVNKAAALQKLGRKTDALKTYDLLVENYALSSSALATVAAGLMEKAKMLVREGERTLALEALGRLEILGDQVQDQKDSLKPEIKVGVEMIALEGKVQFGVGLGSVGRWAEAIEILQAVASDLSERSMKSNWLAEQHAISLHNLGVALAASSRFVEAAWAYEEMIERFGNSDDLGILEGVAMAQNNRGVLAYDSGRVLEAIAFFNRAIATCDRSGSLEWIALSAQLNKEEALIAVGERLEAANVRSIIDKASHNPKLPRSVERGASELQFAERWSVVGASEAFLPSARGQEIELHWS